MTPLFAPDKMNWEEWKLPSELYMFRAAPRQVPTQPRSPFPGEHPSNFTDPRFIHQSERSRSDGPPVMNTLNNVRKFRYILCVIRLRVNNVSLCQQNGDNDDYSKFNKRINVNQGIWYKSGLFNQASFKRNYFYRVRNARVNVFHDSNCNFMSSTLLWLDRSCQKLRGYRRRKYFANCSH